MAEFTKGEWKRETDDFVTIVTTHDGNTIAEVVLDGKNQFDPDLSQIPPVEGFANGFLIWAAPDLYKELHHLVSLMEPKENDGSLNIAGLATLNGARSALAKAEGKQS